MEITKSEQQKEKQILKNGRKLRDLLGNIKRTTFIYYRVTEGKERERDQKHILKNLCWKLP